jgi:hypothetical protein
LFSAILRVSHFFANDADKVAASQHRPAEDTASAGR